MTTLLNPIHDDNIDQTRRHIVNDINKIKRHLKKENFDTPAQYVYARRACQRFLNEAQSDLEHMAWEDLFHKYRVTFWEGVLHKQSSANSTFDTRD